MRRILAASLLLFPSIFPAAAIASQPVDDSSAPTQAHAISTGVTYPTLLKTADVLIPHANAFDPATPRDAAVVLNLNVDQFGKPQAIQIVDSPDPNLDQYVIDAVRDFRWRPATLDQRAVPMNLTLKVVVQH